MISHIPAEWKDIRKKFLQLSKKETRARSIYRRNVEDAYEPIPIILNAIIDLENLADLEDSIKNLHNTIPNVDRFATQNSFREVEKALGKVAGAGLIRNNISRARRLLKKQIPKKEKAFNELDKALITFQKEIEWRKVAKNNLLEKLTDYQAAISYNIGLRQQERLTTEQAKEVAICQSSHKDISLNF